MNWISVDDRMPEKQDADFQGQVLAIWNKADGCCVVSYDFTPRRLGDTYGFTHWMPLPAPPEVDE